MCQLHLANRQGPDDGAVQKFQAGPVQLQQDAVLLVLLQTVQPENGRGRVQVRLASFLFCFNLNISEVSQTSVLSLFDLLLDGYFENENAQDALRG